MGLGARLDRPELMDTIQLPLAEMKETLRFLEVANRWFGGAAVILRFLDAWTRETPLQRPLHILDVGTGAADIPLAIARWARRRNVAVRITGLDAVPEVTALARENTVSFPEIAIEEGDLFSYRQSADVVIASLFLHHVPPAQNAAALAALDRIAVQGLIISDLQRGLASFLAVSAASYLLGNRIVRHDGPLSVRRAFRPKELQSIAHEAGLSYLRVQKEPWFRLSLAGRKHA